MLVVLLMLKVATFTKFLSVPGLSSELNVVEP
jgi:hypothetical protein